MKVTINVTLKSWGHYCDKAKIEGSTNITTAQARMLAASLVDLAASLVDLADKEDAKVAAKAAHEERRKKWREREIASGRMKVFGRFS